LEHLLREAVKLGASDLHLSTGSEPRVRIHGVLTKLKYRVLNPVDIEELIFSMDSVDARARTKLNTVGQYDLSLSIAGLARFRINIFRQKGDYAAVFRILNSTVIEYNKLGLPLSVFNLKKKRRGLVLIVGPTGSGKTTTLASFIDLINQEEYKHIITLEEPIEYLHWHKRSIINQREIGADCESFQSGLRAALREDPDVILIGEMRDYETTEIAVRSAETGHLVCSTLHTLGASETINRVVDMYPEKQQVQVRNQLVSILEAVISQQLLPRKDGKGYTIAYEIMYKDSYVKECIRENRLKDLDDYLNTEEAMSEGMCTMDSVILDRYFEGLITREIAIEYAFDQRAMRATLELE